MKFPTRLRHALERRGWLLHAQALYDDGNSFSEDPDSRPHSLWWHGRAWLTRMDSARQMDRWSTSAEWHVTADWLHAGLTLTDDRGVVAALGCPPVALWFGLQPAPRWLVRLLPDRREHEFHVGIDLSRDLVGAFGTLRWSFGIDPYDWSYGAAHGRSGSWSPFDTLFGRHVHAERTLVESVPVGVLLTEGHYRGVARFCESTWTRPRFPWWPSRVRLIRADVAFDPPIPLPGKGENDYDQGDDALYDITLPVSTAAEAGSRIAALVEEQRLRHGGPTWCAKKRMMHGQWEDAPQS